MSQTKQQKLNTAQHGIRTAWEELTNAQTTIKSVIKIVSSYSDSQLYSELLATLKDINTAIDSTEKSFRSESFK